MLRYPGMLRRTVTNTGRQTDDGCGTPEELAMANHAKGARGKKGAREKPAAGEGAQWLGPTTLEGDLDRARSALGLIPC